MRRLWFKAEMRDAILAGKKTATSRLHPLNVGEDYLAVSGSRFKAVPFCILNIDHMVEGLAFEDYLDLYKAEGFESREAMAEFIEKSLPEYMTQPLFNFGFTVKPLTTTATTPPPVTA